MADSCILTPEVNGEDSKLYIELTSLIKNRPLANFIYASYLANYDEVSSTLDGEGKKRNAQGQHSGKDVYNFFKVSDLKAQILKLDSISKSLGSKDDDGKFIDYSDAKEALNIAFQINQSEKAFTATVVQKGDKFNIIIEPRDARTIGRVTSVEETLNIWSLIERVFNSVGVDINALSQDSLLGTEVNATKGASLISYLKNLQNTRPGILSLRDLKLLLSLNPNSTRVQRLITKYGSIEDAAQKIYNIFRRIDTATSAEERLILAALDECTKYNGLDIDRLLAEIQNTEQNTRIGNPEYDIKKLLEELNEKYNIDINIIHLTDERINSLTHAAANALITLKRQLRELESTQGISQETKDIEEAIRTIQKEIDNKSYYSGCLKFLSIASKQIQEIQDEFERLKSLSGTDKEILRDKAQIINKTKELKDAYLFIVEALSDMKSLISEESISDQDIQNIETVASDLRKNFIKLSHKIENLGKDTFLDICTSILGTELPNGAAIADLVQMASSDSTMFDWIRAMGDCSNTLIASMGGIIQEAQQSRNAKITELENRINRATKKLFDSGSDSSFMYGSDGYIISDLDWESFEKAKAAERKRLKKLGYRGLELKAALDDWELDNTEERIVDKRAEVKRAERVPGPSFRKPFPYLTDAQLEYYEEMMQIKGEIGTLMPAYAQQQYVPPQLRRSFLDAISSVKDVEGIFNKAKHIAKVILKRVPDLWRIREDDTEFHREGIVDGETYGFIEGNLSNNPIRNIPIFYVHSLKDQEELLKDFSGGLQALAGTAINYDAMSQVKEIIEFMGEYIKSQNVHYSSNDGTNQAELIAGRVSTVVKDLYDIGKATNTTAIIDGFIDQHLYGIKNKNTGKFAKLWQTLLRYTSIKNLSVNIPGAISNWTVAEIQMVQEAAASEFYGFKDFAYAHARLFGDATTRGVGKLVDFFNNDKNSIDVLLADFFDPVPGRFHKQAHKRYHKNIIRRGLDKINPMFLYATGETIVHFAGMYAVLHHEKVLLNGEEINLINAFDKTPSIEGTSELKLLDGVTDLEGNPITLDGEYLQNIKNRIKYANQTSHGGMDEDSKGIINQRMLGKSIMQFRQWMVKVYDRRYKKEHYDTTLKELREGSTRTAWRVMGGIMNEYLHTSFENIITLEQLKDDNSKVANMRRKNIKRYAAERAIWCSLVLLSFAIADLEEDEDNFWFRLFLYNHKRLFQDVSNMTATGTLMQVKSIASHPIPMLNTINGFLYPIYGLEDITKEIEHGKDQGKNKFVRNFFWYTVPFYKQIDQLLSISEDDRMFGVFDTANRYR